MSKQVNFLEGICRTSSLDFVWGVLLVAAGILFSDIPTMIASQGWPAVEGVVASCHKVGQKFKEYDGDYYTNIDVYLRYEYTVGGIDYSSTSLDGLEMPYYPEETASIYPEGEVVTVYYNPRDPSQAVLEPGIIFSPRAFGLLAALLSWGGLFFLARGLWQRLTGRSGFLRGWPDEKQSLIGD